MPCSRTRRRDVLADGDGARARRLSPTTSCSSAPCRATRSRWQRSRDAPTGTGVESVAVGYLDDPYGRGLVDAFAARGGRRGRFDIAAQVPFSCRRGGPERHGRRRSSRRRPGRDRRPRRRRRRHPPARRRSTRPPGGRTPARGDRQRRDARPAARRSPASATEFREAVTGVAPARQAGRPASLNGFFTRQRRRLRQPHRPRCGRGRLRRARSRSRRKMAAVSHRRPGVRRRSPTASARSRQACRSTTTAVGRGRAARPHRRPVTRLVRGVRVRRRRRRLRSNVDSPFQVPLEARTSIGSDDVRRCTRGSRRRRRRTRRRAPTPGRSASCTRRP